VLGKHTLKAHESTILTTVYNTLNLPGPFRKTVTLTTDVPGQNEIEITLEGVVKEAPCAKIQVTPRRFDVGVLKPGSEKKQTITIANTGTLPLHVKKIFGRESNKIYSEFGSEGLVIEPGRSVTRELVIRQDQVGGFTELIGIESDARNGTRGVFVVVANGKVEP
jgi:hypothetical protein